MSSGRTAAAQLSDATDRVMQVRVLIAFLRTEHPESLPRSRNESVEPQVRDRGKIESAEPRRAASAHRVPRKRTESPACAPRRRRGCPLRHEKSICPYASASTTHAHAAETLLFRCMTAC